MGGKTVVRVYLIAAAMVVLAVQFSLESVRAHTPTALTAQNPTVCVTGGGSVLTTLYNAVTPSDRDWTVRLRIGLTSGGDTVQNTVFSFYMHDNGWSTLEPMANWGVSTASWLYNPGFVHQAGLEIHAGGTMTLKNVIDNFDATTQCYSVYARAFYHTD